MSDVFNAGVTFQLPACCVKLSANSNRWQNIVPTIIVIVRCFHQTMGTRCFPDLLCASVPFFPLHQTSLNDVNSDAGTSLDLLRGLLVTSGKECVFKKVVQTTMIREKQHGPTIELNRIQVFDIS